MFEAKGKGRGLSKLFTIKEYAAPEMHIKAFEIPS